MSATNRIVTAQALAPPSGFAHAVVAGEGRCVWLGGQTAQGPDGRIVGTTMAEQFDQAAGNVVAALGAAGGAAEHLVSMQIYVTDVGEYRDALAELAPVWRRWFGRRYPAISLLGVNALFDVEAKIELVATAVVPATTE